MCLICLLSKRFKYILTQKILHIRKRMIFIQRLIQRFGHHHHINGPGLHLCHICHLCSIIKLLLVRIRGKINSDLNPAVLVIAAADHIFDLLFKCICITCQRINHRYCHYCLYFGVFIIIFCCKYKRNRGNYSKNSWFIIHPNIFQLLSGAHSF